MMTGVDLVDEALEGAWPEGFEAGPTEDPEDEDVDILPGMAGRVSATVPPLADTEQPQILLGPRAKMLKVGPKMDARGADLEGTEIVGQDLTGARFDNAQLRGARISDCDLFNASFQSADLRGATLTDCRIAGADFTDALINGIIGANHHVGRDTLEFTQEQIETTASFRKKDLSDCYVLNYSNVDFFDFRDDQVLLVQERADGR